MVQKNNSPVRLAREQAGYSQVQLSLRSKKSLSTVRLAEQGIATRSTLASIAAALGVDVDELTGRKLASVAR